MTDLIKPGDVVLIRTADSCMSGAFKKHEFRDGKLRTFYCGDGLFVNENMIDNYLGTYLTVAHVLRRGRFKVKENDWTWSVDLICPEPDTFDIAEEDDLISMLFEGGI